MTQREDMIIKSLAKKTEKVDKTTSSPQSEETDAANDEEKYHRIIETTSETSTWTFRFTTATPTLVGSTIPLVTVLLEVIIRLFVQDYSYFKLYHQPFPS